MRGMGRAVCPAVLAAAATTIGGCVSASLGTNTDPHPPIGRSITRDSRV